MSSYKLVKPYFAQHKLQIAVGLISLITVDILQLSIPRIVKKAIDSLTVYETNSSELLKYAAVITICGVLIGILRYIWRRCLIGLSRYIERELRDKLFKHVHTLSLSFFNRTRTGDLMAHATNDMNHIRMATGMGLVALTDGIFLGTASIIFMIYIDPYLTLFAIIPMPFIFLTALLMSRKMHRTYQETQAVFSTLTEKVRELFSGIRIVKSYKIEEIAKRNVNKISKEYVKKNLILTALTGMLFPLMMMISNISIGIVLYKGGQFTILNQITPGDFVAFMSYLGLLVWPMMAVGWVTNLIQRGRASLDRLNVIFETPPEITGENNALTSEVENISLENVSFTYPDTTAKVLNNISMKIKKGQIVGIAGPQGSGKTTLLNLLPRLFDPDSGTVTINDRNIKDLNITNIRGSFSFMEQEPFMFSGSIKDNITFGKGISDNEMNKVLKLARLDKTIENFPDGLETIIGEKGVILSGGQKQRVALARALFKDESVYILDDPISQVDTKTSSEIIATISSKNTVILTSHRYSAFKNADIIYILENGEISAKGTHDELLENNDYYKRSYERQTFLGDGI